MNTEEPLPEGTRADLIATGLRLFGKKGFSATSTREIVAEAGTNVASIAYHFGGKDGLRRACGEEVARRIGGVLSQAGTDLPDTPEAAAQRMEQMLRMMVMFLAGAHEADDIVAFMLREVGEDGPVLDAIYTAMIEPMHRRLCALWSIATGRDAESETTRLVVFSVVGQVLYFRVGRPIVQRRLGWSALGAAEAERVADVVAANLHAILERERTR